MGVGWADQTSGFRRSSRKARKVHPAAPDGIHGAEVLSLSDLRQ